MKKDMLAEIQIMKKHEKIFKRLLTTLLELILINRILMIMKNLVKQVLTLLNQLKNKPKS